MFLYDDYEPLGFWWEVIEMLRRFFLVGLLNIINPGSITQLVFATTFCIFYLVMQVQVNHRHHRPCLSAPPTALSLGTSRITTLCPLPLGAADAPVRASVKRLPRARLLGLAAHDLLLLHHS